MMPLWTTASRGEACGWALASVGLPCVAQRVWPMPIDPAERLGGKFRLEVLELALGPPPVQPAVLERRDAGRIVAAVFEAFQRIDDRPGDRTRPNTPTMPHIEDMLPSSPESGRPRVRPRVS